MNGFSPEGWIYQKSGVKGHNYSPSKKELSKLGQTGSYHNHDTQTHG